MRAKVRLSERKCKFICNFPSVSTFGEAKGTIKRAKMQKKHQQKGKKNEKRAQFLGM